MLNRRLFIKNLLLAGAATVVSPQLLRGETQGPRGRGKWRVGNSRAQVTDGESRLIVPKAAGMRITGTFLDEISHDIPHQNWGEKEWDRDFRHMKAIGIDTVIDIRSGYRKFITYLHLIY